MKIEKIKYLTKSKKKNPQISDIEEIIPNARVVAGGYGTCCTHLVKGHWLTWDSFICMWANTWRKPTTASHSLLCARLCWLPVQGPCSMNIDHDSNHLESFIWLNKTLGKEKNKLSAYISVCQLLIYDERGTKWKRHSRNKVPLTVTVLPGTV